MRFQRIFVRNDLSQGVNVTATLDESGTLFVEFDNQAFPEHTNPKAKRIVRLDADEVPFNLARNYKSVHYWERKK